MVINVSVQFNGGLLPDIILLTLCDYIEENPFNTMKSFCPFSQCPHLNLLTCLKGLDAFTLFFKRDLEGSRTYQYKFTLYTNNSINKRKRQRYRILGKSDISQTETNKKKKKEDTQ